MKAVVMVVFVEAIPFIVLYGVLGCPLCRRSRFWLRFAGVVIAMLLPVLVAILAPVGEQTGGILLLVGFGWGVLLALSSIFVLFHGRGFDAGWGDDDGEGPGPGDGRPTPPAPIGGIPLPDAGPSSTRVRDHRRRGAPRVLVGRLASGNASRHGFGRYGYGRPDGPAECAPEPRGS